jgi:tRNA threonylcarbamoyladenosine biosynthesis protein TsaB
MMFVRTADEGSVSALFLSTLFLSTLFLLTLFVPDSESPLILSLETATRAGSVALARGAQLLALRGSDAQASRSARLLQSVEEILEEAGASLPDVELFAAASGPGSFTGLRIGLATVKSFAATLSRKCVGINTLAAVAHAAGASRCTLAMIPAGRGEVFGQLLSVQADGEVTTLNEAVHQTPEKLLDSVAHIRQLKFAGEGLQQYEPLIRKRAEQSGLELLNEDATHPEIFNQDECWIIARPAGALAGNIAILAHQYSLRNETTGPEQLRAFYVRPSDAELNVQQQ